MHRTVMTNTVIIIKLQYAFKEEVEVEEGSSIKNYYVHHLLPPDDDDASSEGFYRIYES